MLADETKVESNERKLVYTSATGVTVIFKPLPPTIYNRIEIAYEREQPRPTPPTYEVESMGEKETFAHTEDSVQGDPTAEKAWKVYQDRLSSWDGEVNKRLHRYAMLNCLVFDMPEDDGWVRLQEASGMIVPADPIEKRLHYIETVFIGSHQDVVNILAIPMQLSMERSAETLAAERLFQLAVERAKELAADKKGEPEQEHADMGA